MCPLRNNVKILFNYYTLLCAFFQVPRCLKLEDYYIAGVEKAIKLLYNNKNTNYTPGIADEI
jgi:hypothetical protein